MDIVNDADNKMQRLKNVYGHALIESFNFEISLENVDEDFISSFTDIAHENFNFYQSYKVFTDESSYENNPWLQDNLN